MANEKKQEFTVTDRRKFTFDGDLRPDTEPAAEPAGPPAAPEAEATAPIPPEAEPPRHDAPPFVPETPTHDAPQPSPETGYDADQARSAFGGEKIEFIHLLDLLVQNAMVFAGALDTGTERRVDIVGLRHMIDMIAVLEDRTKGNLTEQEHAMLSRTLFQLRMTYMEIINMIQRQATEGGPGAPPVK